MIYTSAPACRWSGSQNFKFEGPDPAFWVNEGYVILNPDPRGAYKSEGHISYWGRQLAEDGYDFIEWAAQQSWPGGKVGMAETPGLPSRSGLLQPSSLLISRLSRPGKGLSIISEKRAIVEEYPRQHFLKSY